MPRECFSATKVSNLIPQVVVSNFPVQKTQLGHLPKRDLEMTWAFALLIKHKVLDHCVL